MPDAPATSDGTTADVRIPQPDQVQRPQGGNAAPAQPPDLLPPPTALRGKVEREDRPVEDVIGALAAEKTVSDSEATSALEWFLSEEPDEDVEQTHTIELNVGVGDRERWISWVVRPIDTDELRRIQRTTAALRRRARQDDLAVDELGNIKIVIAGSVEPDIEAIAREKGQPPDAVLKKRFRHKPGLIAQLSNQIMELSGFDDEDVRDAIAAKNS